MEWTLRRGTRGRGGDPQYSSCSRIRPPVRSLGALGTTPWLGWSPDDWITRRGPEGWQGAHLGGPGTTHQVVRAIPRAPGAKRRAPVHTRSMRRCSRIVAQVQQDRWRRCSRIAGAGAAGSSREYRTAMRRGQTPSQGQVKAIGPPVPYLGPPDASDRPQSATLGRPDAEISGSGPGRQDACARRSHYLDLAT